MSFVPPLIGLLRVLAGGGVERAALGLFRLPRGISPTAFVGLQFPNLLPAELRTLIDLATSARAAADVMNRAPIFQRIRQERIPVNPQLFGDAPGGNRFQWEVEVRLRDKTSGKETILRRRIRSAENENLETLCLQAIEEARGTLRAYPQRFGGRSADDFVFVCGGAVSAQRRF